MSISNPFHAKNGLRINYGQSVSGITNESILTNNEESLVTEAQIKTNLDLKVNKSGDTMTGDLIVNANITADTINHNTGYTATGTELAGTTYWDETSETLSTTLKNGVVGQHFEELFIKIQNDTGSDIENGKLVGYAGSIGNSGNMRGVKFLATTASTSLYILGIATETIGNGETGKITKVGKVRGIQTNGANYGESWSAGTILYASSGYTGGLTMNPPQAPIAATPIAVVISAHDSNGTLYVRPTLTYKITDLDDVDGTALTNSGQLLVWDNTRKVFDFTSNINDYLNLTGGTILGNLTITGNTNLGPLTATSIVGDSLIITGNTILENELTVSGDSTFYSSSTFNEIISVNGLYITDSDRDKTKVGTWKMYVDGADLKIAKLTGGTTWVVASTFSV